MVHKSGSSSNRNGANLSDRNRPSSPGPSPISTLPIVDMETVLVNLNSAQLQAVKHDPSIPLQILAGPGSGKTKVLTSRISQLILTHNLEPSSICAVTFTNKAASEMRERLTKLIGRTRTSSLQMGTFHSLCAKFLRKHSHLVNLEANFTICDAEESKRLIGALLKPYKEYLIQHDIAIAEGAAASVISKAKAKGQSAAVYYQEVEASDKHKHFLGKNSTSNSSESTKSIERILAEVYVGYEKILKDNNALDFDDLLVYGVKLFTKHEEAALWCKHILVDEFQDTNTMQYELMKAIGIRRRITIVGDPDQSIYGWRSAEVGNLSRMRDDFSPVQQIFLEQNYRSTASILRSCLAIVSEDKRRVAKSLHSSHPLGATPYIGGFDSEKEEASFIAHEIKRCVANMGGVLKWGDFVVLLRFNALSRPIESALQKEGIPCRILGGHKFFERMEVKDILSYLQLTDNPNFNPAFVRAIKVPSRGTGDKTLSELALQAEKLKISQLQLAEKIYDNRVSDIKPPVKRKITSFVKTIRELRKLDEENTAPSEMIRRLLQMINYEDHLRKTQQDWESRWENVQELITFASEVEAEVSAPSGEVALPHSDDNRGLQAKSTEQNSILRQFLQASMLSSEGDNQTEEESKEKVTLSTCHAAKGLEWPVVIIPSVDQDTFPFYRTEDIDEERRLLYVACTRAQTLLYATHSRKRQVAGKTKEKKLSNFVSVVREKNEGLFSYDVPRFLPEDRAVISKVLDRPVPNEAEVERRLAELEANGDRVQPTFQNSNGGFSSVSLNGIKSSGEVDLSAMYLAPDALASISASFLKDYKKSPFSGNTRPAKENHFNASFVAAGAAYMHPQPSRTIPYSFNMTYDPRIHLNPQVAESSRQGFNSATSLGQSASRLVDQSRLSFTPLKTSATNEPNFCSTTRSTSPQFIHSSIGATPPSTSYGAGSSSYAAPTNSLGAPSKLVVSVTKSPQRATNQCGPTTTLHASKRQASMMRSDSSTNSSYHSSRPSDKCNDRPTHPGMSHAHPTATRNIHGTLSANHSVIAVEKLASTNNMVSSSPALSNSPCPSVVTSLPTTMNRPLPRTEALGISLEKIQSSTPNAGTKRRLGMGRSTAGYSNKKFKRPV